MGKHFRKLLVVLICLFMVWMNSAYASSYMTNVNARTIYDYLKNTMGLNPAACAAVLANIRAESDFDPHNTYQERVTNSNGEIVTFPSYGICQWNRTRLDGLKNYCANHGYDYTTLIGQLHYFDYEIQTPYYKHIYNNLKSAPNTEQGAYDAAVYFCVKFEVPANQDVVGPQRGNTARQIYYELDPAPAPDVDTLQFIDVYYPKQYAISDAGYWLEGGTIASNVDLVSLTTEIYDANGNRVSYATHQLSGKSVSITTFDDGTTGNGLRFSQIKTVGNCRWVLTATDNAGRTLPMEMTFWADYYANSTSDKMSKKYVSNQYFDLNGLLDGTSSGNIEGYGTADVYIGGKLEADDATDYYQAWPEGTSYEIKDIRATAGHTYNGNSGSLSGSIGSTTTSVVLNFSTIKVTGVTLNLTELTLRPDETATLTATITPTDALDQSVAWESSDTTVATVTASGSNPCQATIKALKSGTSRITCTTNDGNFTANCTVTIKVPVTKITLNNTGLTLEKGDSATLTATVAPSNATNKSVTWSSSNTAVATINGGVVRAVGVGNATITCTAADGSGVKATCSVTVPEEVISDFILPSALKEIGEEAFAGIDARRITVPDGVKTIGKKAFADCLKLEQITIPASTTTIANDAFANAASSFTIHGSLNSYAQTFASENGIRFVADDACTITFNANGGASSETSRMIKKGSAIGTLPTASKSNNTLDGWYTSASGGSKVTASSVFGVNTTVYAHWTAVTCTITFNANGGSCGTSTKVVNRGEAVGTLPTPTRTYYTFKGWYTQQTGGSAVTTSTTLSQDQTLYARWELNGFGNWSGWSTTPVTGNDNREVQTEARNEQTGTKTTYSYSRYAYKGNTWNNVSYSTSYPDSMGWQGYWQNITLDYPLTQEPKDGYNDRYVGYYLAIPGATLDWVQSVWYLQVIGSEAVYSNVTYYRYRDRIE